MSTASTTAFPTTVNAPASPLMRIWNVARLHFANPWTTLYWPWLIMAMIYTANFAIVWILTRTLPPEGLSDAQEGFSVNGGAFFFFIYMLIVACQAIAITFPFALGYGTTRRDFYLGSSLTWVMLSIVYSLAMGLMSLIEEMTDGMGIGLRLFSGVIYGDAGWLQRTLLFFVLFLFFFFVGSAVAAVWVRWKTMGISTFFIALGVLVIGTAVLLTFTESWSIVGNFFVTWGVFGSVMWLLAPAAVAAIVGFFILRRATPRTE
jgi:hypothetical protein